MSRRRAVAILALLLGCGALACSPRTTLPRPSALWVLGVDLPRFDPTGPPDPTRAALERLLSRGLVDEDSSGRVVPAAAESIEISRDSLLVRFRLRPDLVFSDGSPCTSRDFQLTLLAGLGRDDHSTRRWQLAALRGVDAIRVGRPLPELGIDTPDARTLRLQLRVADPLLLRKLAIPGTTSPWKTRGPGWRGAVGIGPYRVARADSVRSMVFVRAPSPFARVGLADTLTARFVPVAARVRAMLRSGRPDLVWPLPPDLLAQPLPADYRPVTQEASPTRWLLLVMRADLPPTTRLAARHALGNGINRADVMRALGPQAAEFRSWLDGAPPFDFPRLDPQEIEMWRERGKLGRSFHVVMAYDEHGPASQVARAMQGEWSSHSIYVELAPKSGAERVAEQLSGRAHLVLADEQELIAVPEAALASLVMPFRGPAVGAVRTGWRTREFDRWLEPGRPAPEWDPEWAQRRLEEERVVLPLARLRWAWVERAAGPNAPYHPRYGPECPIPAIPR